MITAADFDDVFACTLSQRGLVPADRVTTLAAQAGAEVDLGTSTPALPAAFELAETCGSPTEFAPAALPLRGEPVHRRGSVAVTV